MIIWLLHEEMEKIDYFTKIKTPTNQTKQNQSAHISARCYNSQLYLLRLLKGMLYFQCSLILVLAFICCPLN